MASDPHDLGSQIAALVKGIVQDLKIDGSYNASDISKSISTQNADAVNAAMSKIKKVTILDSSAPLLKEQIIGMLFRSTPITRYSSDRRNSARKDHRRDDSL